MGTIYLLTIVIINYKNCAYASAQFNLDPSVYYRLSASLRCKGVVFERGVRTDVE